jgi:hypothetical protein
LARFDLPAPGPSLRRLAIDLNELAPAFALSTAARFYLDLEIGDVHALPPVDTPETRSLAETIVNDPERYARVPETPFVDTPEEKTAFAETVEDPRLRERLLAAIRSRAPQVRFERELSRNEAALRRWDAAVQHRLLERTVAWLAELGIAPAPPARPAGKKGAADKHKAPASKRAGKRRKT